MCPTKAQKAAVAKQAQFRRMDGEDVGEDCGAMCESQPPPSGDTATLLEAIIPFCRTSLTAQIEAVKVDISLIQQDFQKLRERVTTAKTQPGLVEDTIPPLQNGTRPYADPDYPAIS